MKKETRIGFTRKNWCFSEECFPAIPTGDMIMIWHAPIVKDKRESMVKVRITIEEIE